jgi:hypothetical protein
VNEHHEFDLLDAHALGTLADDEAARVDAHLRACLACSDEYEQLRGVIDVLPSALPAPPAPATVRKRIMAAIDEPQHSAQPRRRRNISLTTALAAALALALVGDAYLGIARRAPAGGARVVALTPLPQHPSRPGFPRPIGRPTVAPAVRELRAQAATIAVLERRLRSAVREAGSDRVKIRRLEQQLVQAQSRPPIRIVVAPPRPERRPVPRATTSALPPSVALVKAVPAASPDVAAVAESATLIAALRTGRVYAVDGVVGIEPWHLTIVQPRNGDHALIFSGTPGAPAGDTYRTWVIRAGHTVDIGELPPEKPATLQMPMALEPGDVIAFSREPIGAGALPTQPFLMQFTVPQ